MEDLSSFKVLEDVHLKATYNMVINGRHFEPGETIARFDKIQIAGLNEFKSYVAARGGYDNRGLVFWETTKNLRLTFSQGVFSKEQFALLTNSKVLKLEDSEPVLITKTELLESNENGQFWTREAPYDQLFVYSSEDGQKIDYEYVGNEFTIAEPYYEVLVSYRYAYTSGGSVSKIGQAALGGFLELEGKTRIKDDTSGLITTGIIKIPKLKLMSGLSIQLGAQASPVVGTFTAEGVPVEERRNSYVMEFYFLNDNIDSYI